MTDEIKQVEPDASDPCDAEMETDSNVADEDLKEPRYAGRIPAQTRREPRKREEDIQGTMVSLVEFDACPAANLFFNFLMSAAIPG